MANLERPELVRSTRLRKYVATVSQVLNLSTSEIQLLCKHMGHTIDVHNHYYKLPSHTPELAKVSKLLLLVERGQLNTLNGTSLDEIDIESDEIIDDESQYIVYWRNISTGANNNQCYVLY
jgi:hypothetical protein